MRNARPYLLPGVVAAALMGAAAWIYLDLPSAGDRLLMLKETYKYLVQAIVVGIVGGLAIRQWEAQRAVSVDQETFVQAFRKRVAEAYFHTKRARRLLKAIASRARLQEFIADVDGAPKCEFSERFAFPFSDILRALRGEPPREATAAAK